MQRKSKPGDDVRANTIWSPLNVYIKSPNSFFIMPEWRMEGERNGEERREHTGTGEVQRGGEPFSLPPQRRDDFPVTG